ncbi:hypothetical protein BP6252_01890 [Coleophoma cylindrospora]|uniref:Borealin N-terminal domain-containing protein n=1 Tax=Coleophoma cylindrospora TaxID=1849047 RepID=A0A3D8SD87_9HELO|nr:hypothetical protein BP6252_01890 [Coleophoma cylindrospora]
MAPTRQKKRKSTESAMSIDIPNFPAPSTQSIPATARSPVQTPGHSSSPARRQKMGISLSQKQQLVDNLQQEVTERARRLRQQYSAQAQDLRNRIERRVTRIPMHLRRANMGELLRRYNELASSSVVASSSPPKSLIAPSRSSPYKNVLQESRGSRQSPAPLHRPAKRHSDEISSTTDKENEDVGNPKKRPRGIVVPPRTHSRLDRHEPQILSPKSSNTQPPTSPIRPGLSKNSSNRPVSPFKATAHAAAGGAAVMLTNMVEKAKSTRAAASRKVTDTMTHGGTAGRAKKAAAANTQPAPAQRVGRGKRQSDSSETSTGTMIVRKAAPPPKKAPTKRTVMGTIKGMSGPASKKAAPAPKAAGTRVLRKRN